MSKSCYLCFKTKRVLVELIVGIRQSQNQRKVSCTRAKTYARTSKKSHVRELKVMRARRKSHASTTKKSRVYDQTVKRTRAESHVHSSERYRAHEQKVSRIRAKVMRSRERKRLKGQLFFRTVRYSSRIFGNKLHIKRKTLWFLFNQE